MIRKILVSSVVIVIISMNQLRKQVKCLTKGSLVKSSGPD